jgi:hypothetical protein
METREWRFPDGKTRQSMMVAGPWDDEPDKIQWRDPETGLACLVNRGPSGSLCGYVGVSQGHPLYGVDYSQHCPECVQKQEETEDYVYCEHTPETLLNVHGGITFASFCAEGEEEDRICHIVEPGEDDKVWWLGFDTAHAGDVCPAHLRLFEEIEHRTARDWDTYKTVDYMKVQVAVLAAQLSIME